jgi:murein DD-endopeptidase MepM/ murein hydrolase activator NlpD
MIITARAIALLGLIAAAAAPVGPALAAWPDWGAAERAARGGSTKPEAGQQTTVTVERGDTLGKILARAGVLSSESARVMEAMRDIVDPKRLQVGDSVVMTLSEATGQIRLFALHVDFRPDVSLTLVRGQDGAFHAATVGPRPTLVVETITGKVSKSLRPSLLQAGLPPNLADEVIRALNYDPTLPKRIKTGAGFRVIYERLGVAGARKPGDKLRLRYAEMIIGKTPHAFYHYTPPGAAPAPAPKVDDGAKPLQTIKFMNPIEGGKVNSPFGMRLHPVLRKMKLHRGVDFPAVQGTPIYAAADGVVEDMGWRGNFGNYIRLTHDARHATAYGHLDGFAAGIAEGERVTQGQLIGYVGRTGLSTGNHLYWEVLVDNKHVDPLKVRLVQAIQLEAREVQKSKRSAKLSHVRGARSR